MMMIKELLTRAEIDPAHIATLNHDALRESIMVFIAHSAEDGDMDLPIGAADRLSPICRLVGMEKYAEELVGYVVDEELPFVVRERALAAALHTGAGGALFATFDTHTRAVFCGPWVRPMLLMAGDDETTLGKYAQAGLVQLILSVHPEDRTMMVARVADLVRDVAPHPNAISLLLLILTDEQGQMLRGAIEQVQA